MQEVTVRRGPTRTSIAQSQAARAELDALQEQRGELSRQLQQLTERRLQLFAQSQSMGDGPARRELEARISEIDARSARIDGQLAGLNDRIVEAMGRVNQSAPVIVDVPRVITTPQITIPDGFPFRQRGPDMRQIGGIMAAEAVALVLIGAVAWRFGMKRMREQFERMFTQQASQMNQLQQSVDVIGVEVERISEGQRYVAKVLSEGSPATSVGRVEAKVPVGRRDA